MHARTHAHKHTHTHTHTHTFTHAHFTFYPLRASSTCQLFFTSSLKVSCSTTIRPLLSCHSEDSASDHTDTSTGTKSDPLGSPRHDYFCFPLDTVGEMLASSSSSPSTITITARYQLSSSLTGPTDEYPLSHAYIGTSAGVDTDRKGFN